MDISYLKQKPSYDSSVFIAPSSFIYGDISIGSNSSIWPLVSIRGDTNYIKIGSNTNIQDNSVLHVTHASTFNPNGYPLIIGDNVTIGHKCILHGCEIADTVLVGMGSIIMDGAKVAKNVIVGAGSLVASHKTLEEY